MLLNRNTADTLVAEISTTMSMSFTEVSFKRPQEEAMSVKIKKQLSNSWNKLKGKEKFYQETLNTISILNI